VLPVTSTPGLTTYFLSAPLSISATDEQAPERRFCIFVGERAFYGSHATARLLEAIAADSALDAITARLNLGATGAQLGSDQVAAIIDAQLVASGMVSHTPPPAALARPAPARFLFFSRTLLGADSVKRLSAPLAALFAPTAAALLLAASVALLACWLAWRPGAGLGIGAALQDFDMTLPESALFYLALLACFVMHELGHAAAARRFGARPAEIGIGLYLVFLVLFCNVTSTWRLPRAQRIAVNLGGVYFQLLATALLVPVALYVRSDVLDLLIATNLLAIAGNLNPFFRFDGYWVYADLFRLPNLREQSRALMLNVVARAVCRVWQVAPPAPLRASLALRVYSAGALLFAAGFTSLAGYALWQMASRVPALAAAVSAKFDTRPLAEALVDATAQSGMIALYLLGCAASLVYLARMLSNVVTVVRQAVRGHAIGGLPGTGALS
jgi:putative peptide zinc metalloprotease protein